MILYKGGKLVTFIFSLENNRVKMSFSICYKHYLHNFILIHEKPKRSAT